MWLLVCGKIIRCFIGILSQGQPPAAGPGLPSCLMLEDGSGALEVGQSTEVGTAAGGGGLGHKLASPSFICSFTRAFSKY